MFKLKTDRCYLTRQIDICETHFLHWTFSCCFSAVAFFFSAPFVSFVHHFIDLDYFLCF